MQNRRGHLWSALVGGLIAALAVTAIPAVAGTEQSPGPAAVLSPGDPLQAGRVNDIDKTTWLRGSTTNGNLRIRNNTTGPALDLQVPSNLVPPLSVNSKALVPGLNADRVDNRHANELSRAAHALSVEVDEGIFSGGAADILTTSITAPRRGTLLMTASVDASGASDDQYTCLLQVDGFNVAGTSRVSQVHWQGVSHTDNSQENCATTGALDVAAGTHVVDFHVFGRSTAAFHSASLWVMYVPYDGAGDVPIP